MIELIKYDATKLFRFAALALIASGFSQTISVYGSGYLIAYAPIVLLWGYFIGVPPIIGISKVYDTFTPREFAGTLLAQVALLILLVVLLNVIGITKLLVTIIGVGLLNGIAMPASALRVERKDSNILNK